MASLQVTTYEVYIVDNGRWVLHARYRRDEREKAIEEAKVIEREMGTQVKVSREVYNSSDNTSEETTVYASEKPVRRPAGPRAGAARGGGGGGGMFDDFDGGAGGRPAAAGVARGAVAARQAANAAAMQGTVGALGRMIMIIVGSLIGAVAITMGISFVLRQSVWMQIHDSYLGPLQFIIFITSFLIIAIPLATKKVRWAGFSENQPRTKAPPRPVKVKAPPKAKIEEEPTLDDIDEDEPKVEEEKPAEDEKPEEPTAAEDEKTDDAGSGAGVAVEMQRESMGKFTQGLLSEVQKSRPQLDAYNRFGVSLMLAGAVDVVGDKNSLEPDQRRELLASALTDMGTKKDAARGFSAKYEEYIDREALPRHGAGGTRRRGILP